MQRKQELGRTESGGGDLQAQTEQLWQTPATDSFRSRGGERKDEMGLDQQARLTNLFPTPAQRDYRDANARPYSERGGADEGRATAELRGPLPLPGLFPPGPADRDAWREILSIRPDHAPAVSRAELVAWHAHLAGLLDLQTVVAAIQSDSDPRRSYRESRKARAIGRAIRQAVAAQKAQHAIRGAVDVVAGEMDGRPCALRALGNGVVVVQGASALLELLRRANEEDIVA